MIAEAYPEDRCHYMRIFEAFIMTHRTIGPEALKRQI